MKCSCGDCPRGANLRDARCFPRVLYSLDREFGINTVTLSHFVETEYVGESMEMLERMLAIKRLMERMAGRTPQFQGQGNPPCSECELNPGTVFSSLSKTFQISQGKFYDSFFHYIVLLNKGKGASCRSCLNASKSDFAFLFQKVGPFWRWLSSRGEE